MYPAFTSSFTVFIPMISFSFSSTPTTLLVSPGSIGIFPICISSSINGFTSSGDMPRNSSTASIKIRASISLYPSSFFAQASYCALRSVANTAFFNSVFIFPPFAEGTSSIFTLFQPSSAFLHVLWYQSIDF